MNTHLFRRSFLQGLAGAPLLSTDLFLTAAAMGQTPTNSAPLSSWREGNAKHAIFEFVAAVTKQGGPDFVAERNRIAVFDNDGTLWVEQPAYTQLIFILDRIRTLAPLHPSWQSDPLLSAAANGDMPGVIKGGTAGLLRLAGIAQAGNTPEDFQRIASAWLTTTRDRRWSKPYPQLVYQPMLEVLTYLRANGFTTFIVSGGGIEFVRAYAADAYDILPHQVIGSSFALKPSEVEGRVVLTRQPQLDFVDDGPGKPVGIARHIGQRPIAAFGNSDGDFEMLQYTTEGPGRRLGMIVRHDDAIREYAYDRQSKIGRLDRALSEAPHRGWTVVSMKNEWDKIFPWA